MRLYMGLVHFPVYNKHNETICSAITPMDIHDFARLSKTYGVRGFFVITPLEDQQALAHRIMRHWVSGYGARYNHHRKQAMDLVRIMPSLDMAIVKVTEQEREIPTLIATDAAQQKSRAISYPSTRVLVESHKVVLLLFGTAWGLHEDVLQKADHVLAPVLGNTEYNHLSVRTAAAIILDRLVNGPPC